MPDAPADEKSPSGRGTFTGFGVASAVLGVVVVLGVVLAALIWRGHDRDVQEQAHQASALRAAARWTGVLINMNSNTVAQSLQTLHDGTVGQLNANFASAIQPFSQVVEKLRSQTVGQVESVSIESLHRTLPGAAGARAEQPELAVAATRTDTVLVVATSVSQNTGAQPLTVHWALRLGISEVDGKQLVSSVETIR